ncbi:hypothetical protein DCAR_0101630 [Daucus carota subsp. sativus]|uniref:Uncharacterized protein n=1 Tax=Daucus carota subsp. sativus TaxID=79200 RepID=A0A162AH17_DAUCS|nr:hypothetical protein DCAR_0101630 [Daucus carota subsp. sativus]
MFLLLTPVSSLLTPPFSTPPSSLSCLHRRHHHSRPPTTEQQNTHVSFPLFYYYRRGSACFRRSLTPTHLNHNPTRLTTTHAINSGHPEFNSRRAAQNTLPDTRQLHAVAHTSSTIQSLINNRFVKP